MNMMPIKPMLFELQSLLLMEEQMNIEHAQFEEQQILQINMAKFSEMTVKNKS